MNISKMLEIEEGYRSEPYYCTSGYPTVGIGWRIGDKGQSLDDFKHIRVCQSAAHAQLEFQVACTFATLSNKLDFFKGLSEARQCVLVSMAYQMGVTGLLSFKNMLSAMKDKQWNDAAHEGLDSRWAKQTPERAERQMKTLLSGDWLEY